MIHFDEALEGKRTLCKECDYADLCKYRSQVEDKENAIREMVEVNSIPGVFFRLDCRHRHSVAMIKKELDKKPLTSR